MSHEIHFAEGFVLRRVREFAGGEIVGELMKRDTKLKLRKWLLMRLRAIVWHADEWLHAEELKLRVDLRELGTTKPVRAAGNGANAPRLASHGDCPTHGETFTEWEARRSGIAPVAKRKALRRRGVPARAFDLRFSA